MTCILRVCVTITEAVVHSFLEIEHLPRDILWDCKHLSLFSFYPFLVIFHDHKLLSSSRFINEWNFPCEFSKHINKFVDTWSVYWHPKMLNRWQWCFIALLIVMLTVMLLRFVSKPFAMDQYLPCGWKIFQKDKMVIREGFFLNLLNK